MPNKPSNEKNQSNNSGNLIFSSIRIVGGAVLLVGGLFVVLVFTGKLPFPGTVTPEPGATLPVPIPGPAELELVGIHPDQDIAIVRTGTMLPYVTENCNSPVSTKETITQERMFTLSVELDIAESYSSDIERIITGGAEDITQVEMAIAEGIAREMSRHLGIRENESIRVESSREIETPAGYRSAVSLQWEEAHTIGFAIIRVGSETEIKLPFSYVSHMHLAQVGTVYTSCADGTTITSSSGGIPFITSEAFSQNPVQLIGPANIECKNPVSFLWTSEPNRKYMVTARPLSNSSQLGVESAWIEGDVWEQGLPGDLWGSWEWFVTRDDNVHSTPAVFVFNPFPTVDRNSGCSAARLGILDGSELTVENLPSSTPVVREADILSEPASQQEPGFDEQESIPTQDIGPSEPLPTVTPSSLATDIVSPPTSSPSYPPPPTPAIEPSSIPATSYPYPPPPPPTPFVYP